MISQFGMRTRTGPFSDPDADRSSSLLHPTSILSSRSFQALLSSRSLRAPFFFDCSSLVNWRVPDCYALVAMGGDGMVPCTITYVFYQPSPNRPHNPNATDTYPTDTYPADCRRFKTNTSFEQTKIHKFDPVHDDDDRVTAMEGWSGPISTAILSDGSISLSSLCTDPASSSSVEPVLRCSAASAVRTPRVNHNSIFHLSTIRTAPLPSAVSRSGTAPDTHIHAPAYRRRPSGMYDYMYIASLL